MPRIRNLFMAALVALVSTSLAHGTCLYTEPASKSCMAARTIPGGIGQHVVLMDVSSATDTVTMSCRSNVGHVVYFNLTPQVTGNVTVSTCHPMTMYDTVLDVMRNGSGCEWFTVVGCNDNSPDPYCDSGCSGQGSKVTFYVTAGTTYRIRVGSYNQNSAGCELCLGLIVTIGSPCGEPPRDIVCQEAYDLGGTPGVHEMKVDATETPSMSQSWLCPSTTNVSHPVWFKFMPTIDGTATFTTCHANTAYDTVVRAFTGCSDFVVNLGCNDNMSGCGTRSQISFSVLSGREYFVVVGAHSDEYGIGYPGCLGVQLTVKGCESDGDCDDGNVCTQDRCLSWVCSNTPLAAGTSCPDDGNQCTSDQCNATGSCTHPAKPWGTACGSSSNTDCTDPDTCDGFGQCLTNNAPYGTACADDGKQCTSDQCDGSGICTHPAKPVGVPCAEDGNPCTSDHCNGAGACAHPPLPSGWPCGDPTDTACTDPDTCNGAGACLPNHASYGTPCADQWFCNGIETCDRGGICQPGTPPCQPGEICEEEGYFCNHYPEGRIDSPAAGPVTIYAGETISFSGTATDPDLDPSLSYYWDFGVGSGVAASYSEDPGQVRFNNPGLFTVRFTVTDSFGLTDPDPGTLDVRVTLQPPPDPALQMEALDRLRQDSLMEPRVRIERGIPRFVSIRVPVASLPEDPVGRALCFLETYKDLYGFHDPRKQLYLNQIASDGTGGRHVFFGQLRNGIPVFGAELGEHTNGDEMVMTSGNYLKEIPWFPSPEIDALQAEGIARSAAGGHEAEVLGVTKLMYFNEGLLTGESAKTHLAWRVSVGCGADADETCSPLMVLVDAFTRDIIWSVDMSYTQTPRKDFIISGVSSDPTWGCTATPGFPHVQFYDENGRTAGYPAAGDVEADNVFTSVDDTYDFYFDNFQRRGWDGSDGQIDVWVHWGPNNSAATSCGDIRIGNNLANRDEVAHEYTHQVDMHSRNLASHYANQTGALAESYSDVFAAFVDGDWVQGNYRDLSDPSAHSAFHGTLTFPHPDHMSRFYTNADLRVEDFGAPGNGDGICDAGETCAVIDRGGVHINCGIPNKAAYLISEGGKHNNITVGPIGSAKAMDLYYEVLTRMLPSNAQFMDARDLSVGVSQLWSLFAVNTFSLTDACNVINAFASVGLGDIDTDCNGFPDATDTDRDGDGFGDATDNCPDYPNTHQTDTDKDGQGDVCDDDDDNDGIVDPLDNCPGIGNPTQEDWDGDGDGDACDDTDGDSVMDDVDNCRFHPNKYQTNSDTDPQGDVCDADDDNDGIPDDGDGSGIEGDNRCTGGNKTGCDDNCRLAANPDQADGDGDSIGDVCDNCPGIANADQTNHDFDPLGDVCDDDDDDDGVPDTEDNCQFVKNQFQYDFDGNGAGTACDAGERELLYGKSAKIIIALFKANRPIIRVPIPPCLSCPDWLPERYQMIIKVGLPYDGMPVCIVDDRGFVVRKSRVGNAFRSLRFRPRADAYYRAPTDVCSASGFGVAEGGETGTFIGTEYFLEIAASPEVLLDTPYEVELTILSDTDGDNMDDDFEIEHGLNPLSDDGEEDPDKDGFTNAQEYEAGTDPQDPFSFPGMCTSDVDSDGDVDGVDLAAVAQGLSGVPIPVIAKEFGRGDCPMP